MDRSFSPSSITGVASRKRIDATCSNRISPPKSTAPGSGSSCPTASCASSRSSASRRSESKRATGGTDPSLSATSSSARRRASVDRSRCKAAASSVSRLGLDDEPIADSPDGLDPAGLAKLAADLVHRLLKAVLEALIRAPPDHLEQLGARDHVSGAVGQELEHQEGAALQLQSPLA